MRVRGELIDENPVHEEEVQAFEPSQLPLIELIKWYLEITVEHWSLSLIITIFTIEALFGDDVRLIF